MSKFEFNNPGLKDRRRGLRKNQTDAERILWQKLRNKQIRGFKFFRQYSVGPYVLDFYCPQTHSAIELDGSQHLEEDRREYDKERLVYLKSKDVRMSRFWNNMVIRSTDEVLEIIWDALE